MTSQSPVGAFWLILTFGIFPLRSTSRLDPAKNTDGKLCVDIIIELILNRLGRRKWKFPEIPPPLLSTASLTEPGISPRALPGVIHKQKLASTGEGTESLTQLELP